jgi:hypothetical protein
MQEPAWYLAGYESHEGQLELRPDALLFNRKKSNRVGTFAAFGLLGLALSNAFEPMMTIPRAEIQGAYPSPNNPNELAVYTSRGMLVFSVQNRQAWLSAIGLVPQPPPA